LNGEKILNLSESKSIYAHRDGVYLGAGQNELSI